LAWPRDIAKKGYNYLRIRITVSEKAITGEKRRARASSPSVDTCLVGKNGRNVQVASSNYAKLCIHEFQGIFRHGPGMH
jgi:hypothetical protein